MSKIIIICSRLILLICQNILNNCIYIYRKLYDLTKGCQVDTQFILETFGIM